MFAWIRNLIHRFKVWRRRRLWTKALRSGKYKQATGFLRLEDRLCCLGVACEVYQQHVGDLAISRGSSGCTRYGANDGNLPEQVAEWFNITPSGELTTAIPSKSYNYSSDTLINVNDDLKLDFNQIADVIDSGNLKPYQC